MTDFEMDKTYIITGREFLALLSLIPDGTEKAKIIVKNVADREKLGKVNESQIDFLKPCPFCRGEVELRQEIDNRDETYAIHCTVCHIHFTKFVWRSYDRIDVIKEWNERVKE